MVCFINFKFNFIKEELFLSHNKASKKLIYKEVNFYAAYVFIADVQSIMFIINILNLHVKDRYADSTFP